MSAISVACLSLAAALGCAENASTAWPRAEYQKTPVAFATEVLGVKPWEKQTEILEAAATHKRIAVRSGHKVSKSHTAAILAWWFYSSFEDARVVMSSTTARQVDDILWREFRKVGSKAILPLDRAGMHEKARSGLKTRDFREVVGFTAREAEAVAGVSGANLLYILDEASGIPQAIFDAIEGNRAGGARVILFSNPTRTSGEFFEAFHGKKDFYHGIHISSEETPNVVAGYVVIPGLAEREWVEEKKREWGVGSALYRIRVQGEFALNEDGKILSVAAITDAENRWFDTAESGRLCVGLDPAGPGLGGDETAMAFRRGYKISELLAERGLTEDSIVARVVDAVRARRKHRELPALVVVDREGPIGTAVYVKLRVFAESNPTELEVLGIRASDRAHREPTVYDRQRDELFANFVRWVRDGGAIPTDTKLARELNAPKWVQHANGRLKVTPKDELRKELERSPDRADACMLAAWERTVSIDEAPSVDREKKIAARDEDLGPVVDPYDAMEAWNL